MQTIPIDKTQQDQVIAATHSCIQHAGQLLECELPSLPVMFDLKGRAAGMYRVRNEQRQIRYNPYIFGKYFDDNIANTVPHEVAHYITDMLYGIRNVRPHGTEWQAVMQKLGAEPSVSCHYNLEGIPLRRQRRFSYRCACSSHTISTVRHNRVQRGFGSYVCKRCCKPLVFTG